MKNSLVKISKRMSYILRWHPEDFDIVLDKDGYANVQELLAVLDIERDTLNEVVDTNDKKRFAFNEDKTLIRASQGHNKGLDVDIKFEEVNPPHILYHGTSEDSVESILKTGLHSSNRQYVHLSVDVDTANIVAGRRSGKNIILKIDAKLMSFEGEKVYISDNGVYLVKKVDPKYIKE
jgi:putative RNA 2'-phosphotransferase